MYHDVYDYSEPVAIRSRKMSKKRGPLRLFEKIQMVHQVLVQMEYQRDVAKEHRVSESVVSRLVSAAKRKKHMLAELLQLQGSRAEKETQTSEGITWMNSQDVFIRSVAMI